jgi:predicted ATPase
VAGVSFATAAAAAGLEVAIHNIDTVCEGLAQQGQFIEERELEQWPDGTLTASYAFRHAFYQQVLYGRLGIRQRMQLHRLIGERKEAGYREQAADIAAELAAHFEQGRDLRRAVQCHQYAGAHALRRSAYGEARKHCEQGLRLLTKLDDAVLRARQEIALRLILNNVQTATLNFTAVELEQNLQQARQLGQVADDPTLLVTTLIRLSRVYSVRADRRAMEDLAEQDRRLLEQKPDPALAIQLHIQLGNFTLYRGEHAQAQYHYDQILALFDPAIHRSLTFSIGIDPVVQALCFSAWSSCLTGYLDRARRQVERGVARAEAIAHPFSLVSALTFTRFVLNCCGDLDQSRQFMERSITLANKHGFPLYMVSALLGQGSVAVLCGDAETGLTKLREGIEQYRASGAQLVLPYYLSNLAEAYRQLQKPAEGLQVVAEALQLVETNLDVFWEAELHRLKGELTLQQERQKAKGKSQKAKVKINPQSLTPNPQRGVQQEAEGYFLKAIEIARRQEAKLLELRAVMSLARLWQHQGKNAEAKSMLAEIYGWFTEGFDTPDLQAAQALLETLA